MAKHHEFERMQTPTPLTADLKLAIVENCRECQSEDGPLGKVIAKVDAIVTVLAERKGGQAVWSKIATVSMWLVGLLLAAFLNYKFAQFKRLQEDVAAQLKLTQDASHSMPQYRGQEYVQEVSNKNEGKITTGEAKK
jgi:hypothetical protein